MGSIFSEKNMLETLAPYLPEGQEIKAAIHAIVKEITIKRLFVDAHVDNRILYPTPEAGLLVLNKSKVCSFDAYFGFTNNYMIMVPCNPEEWYYEWSTVDDKNTAEVLAPYAIRLSEPIDQSDIVLCDPLTDIESAKVKKNWIGAYNCEIEFGCGDAMRIQLPRLGGLGGGMPNHARYRDAIVDLLQNIRR